MNVVFALNAFVSIFIPPLPPVAVIAAAVVSNWKCLFKAKNKIQLRKRIYGTD